MNFSGSSPKIYFRLDFGGLIGRGHLSRCLSVAQSFKSLNIEPIFVIRKRPAIESEVLPFKTIWLKSAPDVLSTDTFTWKCGSEEEESLELQSHLEVGSLVFLDHYALGEEFKRSLRKKNHQVISFQDVPEKTAETDLIINYNINAQTQYQDRSGALLLGPSFVPLHSSFRRNRKDQPDIGPLKNVGIYLGGIDFELVRKMAGALEELAFFHDLNIEWVVNNDLEKEELEKRFSHKYLKVHNRLPTLLDLYLRTDLFIGACGLSFFERACCGILQFNFLVADNQKDVARSIHESDLGFVLGDLRTLDSNALVQVLKQHCELSHSELQKKVASAYDVIDGLGAERIAQHCQDYFKHAWSFRKLDVADSAMVLNWRNDPKVYKYLFSPRPVSEEDHENWLKKMIKSESAVFLIAEYKKVPVGTVRFDFNHSFDEAEIGIYLSPDSHGQGLSRHMLMNAGKSIRANVPSLKKIIAKVLLENQASLKMFLSAGYKKVAVENNYQLLEKIVGV